MHCLSHRKPCLKPSSYSISPLEPLPQPATPPPSDMAPKGKGGCCQIKNAFADNRGYPDQINYHNNLLHNIDSSPVLQKLRHPPPPINKVSPSFDFQFDKTLHGARLRQQLDLSHLNDALQTRMYTLIQKYWLVFDKHGVWVPVKNYKCIIDTGNTPPITIKNIQYGPKELPIMRKAIAGLKQVGHVHQIHNGRWLFTCVLAARPHQEHVRDINKFV